MKSTQFSRTLTPTIPCLVIVDDNLALLFLSLGKNSQTCAKYCNREGKVRALILSTLPRNRRLRSEGV